MARKPSLQRIAIAGELSIFTAAAIRADLLAALDRAKEVEVDLTQVTTLDSAGVQLMVAAKREAAALDKRLRFCGHSPAVLDTLDLTDLSAYFGDPVLIQSHV